MDCPDEILARECRDEQQQTSPMWYLVITPSPYPCDPRCTLEDARGLCEQPQWVPGVTLGPSPLPLTSAGPRPDAAEHHTGTRGRFRNQQTDGGSKITA